MKNTSPLQTDFSIELAGKSYTLTFPLPALWAFEDAAGVDIFAASSGSSTPEEAATEFNRRVFGASSREHMQRISALLWAGLITHHPEITLAQARAMVFPHNMVAVKERVLEAFGAAMPRAEEQPSEGGEERPTEATAAAN